ncbi:MAG: phenyltransferase domain-containing protein [Desulfamplus sp.]|nr:phenyltransferase domain-containing protein [Desulfamplus sp.]
MDIKNLELQPSSALNIDSLAGMIADLQHTSGEIPWHEGGKTDPWDLVESAMGLNIGGLSKEADLAFQWMVKKQNENGSWFSSYINGVPEDRTMETNMSAYIATGVFHTWLIRQNKHNHLISKGQKIDSISSLDDCGLHAQDFLQKMWPCVQKGIDFAISLQTDRGEIYWAKSPQGNVDPMALLTGSSSIFMSLKCALSIAHLLGIKMPRWEKAFEKLGSTIKNNIHIYNISKSRFSMYWFYPILSGALTGEAAIKRVEKYWKKYVVEGQGIRCVSDRPWITMAETSEFVIALAAMGNMKLAKIVFSWIQERTYDDGTFWCGYTFPDMVIWPEEKISWTNGVVLMAADALYGLTPASNLFNHDAWNGFRFKGLMGNQK